MAASGGCRRALRVNRQLAKQIAAGWRLADLFGTARGNGLLLTAQLAGPEGLSAFCQSIECMAGTQVPWTAALVRTLHAELERLACHLDVIVRLSDDSLWHDHAAAEPAARQLAQQPEHQLLMPAEPRSRDALARLEVRVDEIAGSFHLMRQAADELAEAGAGPLRFDCEPVTGRAAAWAEAPQGKVVYDVRIENGLITRCRSRSASFHNLVLMHEVFAGDILTDFPFIEASFGLSVAGVGG